MTDEQDEQICYRKGSRGHGGRKSPQRLLHVEAPEGGGGSQPGSESPRGGSAPVQGQRKPVSAHEGELTFLCTLLPWAPSGLDDGVSPLVPRSPAVLADDRACASTARCAVSTYPALRPRSAGARLSHYGRVTGLLKPCFLLSVKMEETMPFMTCGVCVLRAQLQKE